MFFYQTFLKKTLHKKEWLCFAEFQFCLYESVSTLRIEKAMALLFFEPSHERNATSSAISLGSVEARLNAFAFENGRRASAFAMAFFFMQRWILSTLFMEYSHLNVYSPISFVNRLALKVMRMWSW